MPDREGLFQAIALPPGKYTFDVDITGREPISVEFEAGKDITLRVP